MTPAGTSRYASRINGMTHIHTHTHTLGGTHCTDDVSYSSTHIRTHTSSLVVVVPLIAGKKKNTVGNGFEV